MTLDKSSAAERDLLSLLQSIKDEAVAGVLEKAVDNTLLSSVEVTRRNKVRNIVAALKKVVTPELSAADLGSAWLRALAAAVQEVRGSVSKTTTGSILSFMAVAIYDAGMMDEGPFRSWLEDGNMDIILWAINSGNYTNAKWSDRFVSDAVSSDGYPPFDIVFKRKPGNAVGLATVWTDTECQAVRAIILDSMKDGNGLVADARGCSFYSKFNAALETVPKTSGDFTVSTLTQHASFVEGIEDKLDRDVSTRALAHFYIHLITKYPDAASNFTFGSGLVVEAIRSNGFIGLWNQGYRCFIHNPLDPVPSSPKWLLFPSDSERAATNIDYKPWPMDISYPDGRLQQLLVEWLWRECENVIAMRRLPDELKKLFDTFDEPKDGGVCRRATNIGISRWLAGLRGRMAPSGVRHYKGWARSIIEYGVERRLVDMDQAVPLLLSASEKSNRWTPDESKAADPDDMRLLTAELERRATNGGEVDKLVYTAFVVQALTPLRIGDILSLKIDSIVEGSHEGVRKVRMSSKMDGYGSRDIQLPKRAWRLLSDATVLTDGLRKACDPSVRDSIFLIPAHRRNEVRPLTQNEYARRLNMAAEAVGATVTSRMVRRRYETEVVIKGAEKNLSLLALRPLTGHSSLDTTERYYVRDDVRSYLEATYGIEIGVAKIAGEIVESLPEDVAPTDAVELGAGFCRNPECNIPGTVTCLMCSGFLTTPDCIPEMKEAVAAVREQIHNAANNIHERDHLLDVERLYLGYLAVMESMKEALNAR